MRHLASDLEILPRRRPATAPGPWKLYCIKDHYSLYNLDDDISEIHNLGVKHPDRLKELVASLEQWERDVDSSALGRKE